MEKIPSIESPVLEKLPFEEEPSFLEKHINTFFNEITKADDLSPEKIKTGVKTAFNEVGIEVMKRVKPTIEKASRFKRLEIIERCIQETAYYYADLHDELLEISLLAEGSQNITSEKIIEIREEIKDTLTTYEGRTLLSMYVNRNKTFDSKTYNTENAALQQFLAKYYIRNSDNMEKIGPRLDTFGKKIFEKVFGKSERDEDHPYEQIKKGVISLAEATMHLESQGNRVFFPPPRIDAEKEIDLFAIEGSLAERFENELSDLFSRNFSIEELSSKNIDPEILKNIRIIQVKTCRPLLEKYIDTRKDYEQTPTPLEKILEETTLNTIDLGETNEKIIKETTFQTNTISGIGNHRSRVAVLSCDVIPTGAVVSYSSDYEVANNLKGSKKAIAEDLKEAISFFRRAPRDITKKSYLYVNHTNEILETKE